jgi:predicted small secreted protein
VNRRLAVLPLLAVALFGLAACNNTTTGSGTPATTPTSDASSGGGGTTPGGGAGGGGTGTASLQPCDLLGASVLDQNQLTKSDSSSDSGARSCGWENTTQDNGAGYSLGIDIRDSQGTADANTGGYAKTTDNVGSHQGVQLESSSGDDCIVAIGVTSTSRVDVVVSTSNGGACTLANQFANVVEPQLPSGNG